VVGQSVRLLSMSEEQILWECQDQMNPHYYLKVIRLSPYKGLLTVSFKGDVFHKQEVPVMYDAKFGADYSDMNQWSMIACQVTQDHEESHT
jgi:hypothetical protein